MMITPVVAIVVIRWLCRGGYGGFHDEHRKPIMLTPDMVDQIHHEGGTILGSSRGGFDIDKIIDFLNENDICQLYVIGGDGTHRGANIIGEVSKWIARLMMMMMIIMIMELYSSREYVTGCGWIDDVAGMLETRA